MLFRSIEDGHTNCRLPKQVMNEYMSNTRVFPAMVMFIHHKAFVFCCKQKDELAGAELLSIDHHPMGEIIQRLFSYIPSDGRIESRKNWEMPENFQFLYSTIYGVNDSFSISCKTSSGEIENRVLQADYLKNFLCPSPFQRPDKYLQLSYTSSNIAV